MSSKPDALEIEERNTLAWQVFDEGLEHTLLHYHNWTGIKDLEFIELYKEYRRINRGLLDWIKINCSGDYEE